MMTIDAEEEEDYMLEDRKGHYKKDSVSSITTLVPSALSGTGHLKRNSR